MILHGIRKPIVFEQLFDKVKMAAVAEVVVGTTIACSFILFGECTTT